MTYFWASFDVVSALSLALLFRSVVRTEMGRWSAQPDEPHPTQPLDKAHSDKMTSSK